MRIVNMTVTGDLVEVDGSVVGVQGSGNADTLRLTFDAVWDGWAKTAVWWDAHGGEAVSWTLTADLLEDVAVSVRRYLLPVPRRRCGTADRATWWWTVIETASGGAP